MNANKISKKALTTVMALFLCSSFMVSVCAARGETTEPITETVETSESSEITDTINETISDTVSKNQEIKTIAIPEIKTEVGGNAKECEVTITLAGIPKLTKEVVMTIKHVETGKRYSLTFLKPDKFMLTTKMPTGPYEVESVESNDKNIDMALGDSAFGIPYFEKADITVTLSATIHQNTPMEYLKDNSIFLILLAISGISLLVIKRRKKAMQ